MTASTARASPVILKFMTHKATDTAQTPTTRAIATTRNKRRAVIVACAMAVVLLLVLVFSNQNNIPRHPNLATFCSTYNASGSPEDLSSKVSLLRKLEEYAPSDIYPTVHKMRVTYEQAEEQPNNYFGLEAGITGSINNFNDYTSTHCTQ
jgi:hypothetical protein